MGDDGTEPWRRREGETAKAHAAFLLYVELGYGQRSLSKVGEKSGKSRGYERVLQRWSSKHEWVARADAYDAHELAEAMAQRDAVRERLRQSALDAAPELLGEMVKIAMGNGAYTETGGPASRDQIEAIDRVLALAGAAPPKQIEMTGKGGAPLVPSVDPRDALRSMLTDPDAAAALRTLATRRGTSE